MIFGNLHTALPKYAVSLVFSYCDTWKWGDVYKSEEAAAATCLTSNCRGIFYFREQKHPGPKYLLCTRSAWVSLTHSSARVDVDLTL